jgi:hypothetical protein
VVGLLDIFSFNKKNEKIVRKIHKKRRTSLGQIIVNTMEDTIMVVNELYTTTMATTRVATNQEKKNLCP